MAVTLKIEEKKTNVDVAPAPDLSDYVAEGERGEGTKAFIIWFVAMILLSLVLALVPVPTVQSIGIGIGAWWFLSVAGYFFIGPKMLLRRLRLEEKNRITSRTFPRLAQAIAKGSAIVGIPEPEAYCVPDGISQVKILGTAPQFIVITKAATELLQPNELDALILRSLVHSRENHVRRLTLLQFLADTPPAARVLVWPVSFYAALLNMAWHELADQTADRLTLLILRNPRVLMGALLKQFSISDPMMIERGVSAQDVDSYVQQDGAIDAAGLSVSTQYKIGSAIGDNPYMDGRITAFQEWARSPEFQAALQKLAAKRKA
ncbi:MAG TPA: hypothetical protein VF681_05170 [Abditibacteriaceae bacterium]|jgi:Zn-dependent protease with chaperone function